MADANRTICSASTVRERSPLRMFLSLLCLAATAADCAAAPPDVIASMQRSVSPPLVIRGEHRVPVSLRQRMAQLNIRAVSIAVIRNGKLDWARAYGYADREWKIRATPDTLFQAGSISKPLTALAALQRVEAGTLDLDRNVNDYLKTWKLPDNKFTAVRKVTVRNILNHTAGLTVWGFPGYTRSVGSLSTVDVLDGKGNTAPIRVWKEPDQSWRYSGGGYTILQLLLCDQSGLPFATLMRDAVLKPLDMSHSTYEQPLPEALRAMAAAGYRRNGSKVDGDWHVYPEMAAAGLWTTPSDLAKYVSAIQKANRGDTRLLSSQLTRAMLTPGMNNDGLGLMISEDGLRFGHGGADEGFQADMTGFLDGRAGVVIMTNSDNGGRLAQELMLTLGKLYGWEGMQPVELSVAEVPATTLDSLTGTYATPTGRDDGTTMDIEISRKDDTLVASYNGVTLTLLPESDRKFFDRERGYESSSRSMTRRHDTGPRIRASRQAHPRVNGHAHRYRIAAICFPRCGDESITCAYEGSLRTRARAERPLSSRGRLLDRSHHTFWTRSSPRQSIKRPPQ
jgi:CubicO group peptidase (beta-lactamase class C family)